MEKDEWVGENVHIESGGDRVNRIMDRTDRKESSGGTA
jgi:hypothetical protein